MKLEGARVLLTGAAGGIGAALAEQMLERGASLALIGRSEDELSSLTEQLRATGGTVHAAGADLLDPAARIQATARLQDQLAHRKQDDNGHPLNVVHRDVSPHNLLVSYEGAVKVVDRRQPEGGLGRVAPH